MKADAPIGVFDSGVGGLTVLKEIRRLLPNENIVYLGDTARLPYGEKSPDTILRYSLENGRFLMEKGIKLLVVACNTASAYGLEALKKELPVPVIGVIEPGVERAAQTTQTKRIAVLGTKATIRSRAYQNALLERLPDATIEALACPLFVPLIEENFLNHPAAELITREYLNPLKFQRIDTLLLGCTHYPLLAPLFSGVLGGTVQIVDSASTCAAAVATELKAAQRLHQQPRAGAVHFFVTDDPEKFRTMGSAFLGHAVGHVTLV